MVQLIQMQDVIIGTLYGHIVARNAWGCLNKKSR